MSLLKDFEELCKYVRECTGDDIVCGFCEYDAGTVGEEPIECPGFESNECFVLKKSLRKQYEMYDRVIRCKDCMFYQKDRGKFMAQKFRSGDGICKMHNYAKVTAAKDFCSWAEREE